MIVTAIIEIYDYKTGEFILEYNLETTFENLLKIVPIPDNEIEPIFDNGLVADGERKISIQQVCDLGFLEVKNIKNKNGISCVLSTPLYHLT